MDHPDVSALHAVRLTPMQDYGTLGGRDGAELDSAGGFPSCSWSPTVPSNGLPTGWSAPWRSPQELMWRVRQLARFRALAAAADVLQQLDEGEVDA